MSDRMSLRNKAALVTGACWPMTASGHSLPERDVRTTSALPRRTDIAEREHHVRKVPKTEIPRATCARSASVLRQHMR